ncbi:MAG: 2-C-methyl-D-erythritol 4-phosphate cytidylyltransferase [Pseudomonadales bacterium]|nr:2-C-methyl-D-erythritol 4-phosphate cytidylyltransferase [Pseudomonadales bacterium]
MRNSTRYWCVVPAAGVGKRMGADIPKQYLPLGGTTVIQQTLVKLRKVKQLEVVVLCLSSGDEWWGALKNNENLANDQSVIIAAGGKERFDSVLNGLKALAGKASENDWVLVHDVARPCVRVGDIQTLIEQVSQHSVGGLLGMPVRDTMKRAVMTEAEGRNVAEAQETVCRENLWHALTPQMFRYGDLMQAMTDALSANCPITDEASAIERLGKQPLLVEGHPDNIKITHPEDLALAGLFLKQQVSL